MHSVTGCRRPPCGTGALEAGTQRALPLGEVARQLNGTNELWLAVALCSSAVAELSPPQLAALVAALVSNDVRRLSRNCITEDCEKDANISLLRLCFLTFSCASHGAWRLSFSGDSRTHLSAAVAGAAGARTNANAMHSLHFIARASA